MKKELQDTTIVSCINYIDSDDLFITVDLKCKKVRVNIEQSNAEHASESSPDYCQAPD